VENIKYLSESEKNILHHIARVALSLTYFIDDTYSDGFDFVLVDDTAARIPAFALRLALRQKGINKPFLYIASTGLYFDSLDENIQKARHKYAEHLFNKLAKSQHNRSIIFTEIIKDGVNSRILKRLLKQCLGGEHEILTISIYDPNLKGDLTAGNRQIASYIYSNRHLIGVEKRSGFPVKKSATTPVAAIGARQYLLQIFRQYSAVITNQ